MRIVQAILAGISDGRIIDSHVVMPTPLRNLVLNYNKIAMNDAKLPVVTEETTGIELKIAISMLDPADTVALLHTYCQAIRKADEPTNPESKILVEEKRLRQLVTRLIIISLVIMALMLMGAVIAIATYMGVFKNFWCNQMVVTVSEFIKYLFLSSPPMSK